MVPVAKLKQTDEGLVPEGEGWYVLNAGGAAWFGNDELSTFCHFEGDVRWKHLGLNICVVEPGRPNCMYHNEDNQEGYLIVSGEATLIVEGQERPMRQWNYAHFPPWTEHVLVGAGDRPCVFVAVGRRGGTGGRYVADPVAQKHDAAVSDETPEPSEAYARFSPLTRRPCPAGVLPSW